MPSGNRLHPDLRRMLEIIESRPDGIRSDELARAMPDLSPQERSALAYRLRNRGYIDRKPADRSGSANVWRARR